MLPESRALAASVDHVAELIDMRELEKLKRRRMSVEAGAQRTDSTEATRAEQRSKARESEDAKVLRAVAELRAAIVGVHAARQDTRCIKRLQDAVAQARAVGLDAGRPEYVDGTVLLAEVRAVSAADIEEAERLLGKLVAAAEAAGDVHELLRLYSDERFACLLSPDDDDDGGGGGGASHHHHTTARWSELRDALERVRARKMSDRTARVLAKSNRKSSTQAASVFTAVSSLAQFATLRHRLGLARQALQHNEATLRAKLASRAVKAAATLADAVTEARASKEAGALAFELNRAVLLGVSPAITSQAEELLASLIGWATSPAAAAAAAAEAANSGVAARTKSAIDVLLAQKAGVAAPPPRVGSVAAEKEKQQQSAGAPADAVLDRLALPTDTARGLFRIVLQASALGGGGGGGGAGSDNDSGEAALLRQLAALAKAADFEVDAVDHRGRTALLLATSLDGVPASLVTALVELEADVYGGDRCRAGALCSPLYTAVRKRGTSAVRALVAHLEPADAAEFLACVRACR